MPRHAAPTPPLADWPGRLIRRLRSAVPRALALGLSSAAFAPLAAQRPTTPSPQLEARLDAALTPAPGGLAGIGVNVRAGWYARVGVAATAGALQWDDRWQAVQRLDLTARFLFDPFGEARRGFYAGAGVGVVRHDAADVRVLLLGVVGAEGAPAGRVVPAVELTLGDGVRLGAVLRARRAQGR